MTDTPGYELLAHVHRSNVLDVYDAWDESRCCRCVVKTLRPERRSDARARKALIAEGTLLERLCHPGIVRGYATVRRPQPFVVMETLSGETLSHLIDHRARPLAARELAFLGLHLASALSYLHRNGVLHLDLKPSNVVAEAGRAKVIDLSLARAPGRVRPGTGTWCYLAPEQARGGRVGPAADVWGLGVVLWEAACGDTPFGHESVEFPQLEHRAPSLRSQRPRLPGAVAQVVDGALDPEPDGRPALDEVADLLAEVAGSRG